ncbi:MAG: hypothetical protein AB8G11_18220 [Saprospiraceae bacterium]
MITLKFLQRIFLSLCIALTYVSCETLEEEPNLSYENKISNASFVAQRNINTIATAKRIQGVWNSSKSGDKYKWNFDGNVLSKNIVYSFGEIGTSQSYQVKYLNGFAGESDMFGDFIYLTRENSDKGISYQILKATKQEIILQSKYDDRIILKK